MNSIWFIVGCCFIMLEIGHPGLLYFLALAIGAFAAFGASVLDYSVDLQNTLFFVTSAVAIAIVYFFVRSTNNDTRVHRSNMDQFLGKIVTITEVQTLKKGSTKIGSEVWSLALQGDGQLAVGMKAKVVGIQGCHLQVQLVNND